MPVWSDTFLPEPSNLASAIVCAAQANVVTAGPSSQGRRSRSQSSSVVSGRGTIFPDAIVGDEDVQLSNTRDRSRSSSAKRHRSTMSPPSETTHRLPTPHSPLFSPSRIDHSLTSKPQPRRTMSPPVLPTRRLPTPKPVPYTPMDLGCRSGEHSGPSSGWTTERRATMTPQLLPSRRLPTPKPTPPVRHNTSPNEHGMERTTISPSLPKRRHSTPLRPLVDARNRQSAPPDEVPPQHREFRGIPPDSISPAWPADAHSDVELATEYLSRLSTSNITTPPLTKYLQIHTDVRFRSARPCCGIRR